jgi:hypothetical protein
MVSGPALSWSMPAESRSMTDLTDPLREDDAAAENVDWISAWHLKVEAMLSFAIGVLGDAGVLGGAHGLFEAEYGSVSEEVFAAVLETQPLAVLALVAQGYLEQNPPTDENSPLSAEAAAALLMMVAFEHWEATNGFQRKAADDDLVDFNDVMHMVYLAAEIGSLGEVFRGRKYGFDRDHEVAQAQSAGSKAGAAKKRADADRWRKPVLEQAVKLRARLPHLGQKAVATRALDALKGDAKISALVPSNLDQVVAEIRKAEKAGTLPRSTVNPTRGPEPGV